MGKLPDEEDNGHKYLQNKVAWDDVNGNALDLAMVKAAGHEEITLYRNMQVYKKLPLSDCDATTGKDPVGVT